MINQHYRHYYSKQSNICFFFFHFKCDYCLLFLSFVVSLVLLIYHILFGFKAFTLNVNMSDCLIIYCCLCVQDGLE